MKIQFQMKIKKLGVGPILPPFYLENGNSHTKFVGNTAWREYNKEYKERIK